jgi:hypothetical protein
MAQFDPLAAGVGVPGMPATPAAPAAAPVAEGTKARARLTVIVARKALEMALAELGTDTEEGYKVLQALKPLADIYSGTASAGLEKSELSALAGQAAPGPMPTAPASAMGPQPQYVA